jgi:hypothetical protein
MARSALSPFYFAFTVLKILSISAILILSVVSSILEAIPEADEVLTVWVAALITSSSTC